jgi:acyl-CoA synthetase (AMP-forming)/AMP-acid ligase II
MRTVSYWSAEPGEVRDVTVCDTIRDAAATVPDRLALVDCVPDPAARRQWTYAEFLADIERAARALLARFAPGERIGIWAPNSADWVVLQQGAALAGMVVVALNPAYRARELEFVLRQSGTAGLFCVDSYRDFPVRALVDDLRADLPALREVLSFAGWEAFLASGDPTTALPDLAPTDVLQLQYTSGTTGFPKGAMLHHKGLVNEASFVAERSGFGDGGVYVNAMPMFHIGGGAVTSFGAWAKRGTFVILPGFEPGLVLEAFETYRGTHSLLVPTMLITILDHPDRARRDLSSVQTVLSGAAAVPAALVRRTIEQLGCRFSILFGQTETHGVISQTRVTDAPEDQAGTVGQPLPQLEVKIADIGTGEPVPVGAQGEICCRGCQNMLGYYAQEDETAATVDGDGWLHMGDVGDMDERGYLRVTGRIKDMIVRGGMNLYPAEIEGVLTGHPAIETAAVIGVPDDTWGEQVGAVLRVRAGHERPSADELTAFLRRRLAPHKAPVFWAFRDELPMTPSGKVQKFVLREEVVTGRLAFDEVRLTTEPGAAGRPVIV